MELKFFIKTSSISSERSNKKIFINILSKLLVAIESKNEMKHLENL